MVGNETLKILVVFETGENGWEVASCPTLPGCHSQGRTRDEARANIREAIRGYVASMREHGVPTPSESSFEVVDGFRVVPRLPICGAAADGRRSRPSPLQCFAQQRGDDGLLAALVARSLLGELGAAAA